MEKRSIVKTFEVVGFSMPGKEEISISRVLIDKESVGSKKLFLAHYTLKAGKKNSPRKHPCPHDETYYILKGKAILTLGDKRYEIEPGMAIFIPCGVLHGLENIGKEDFELIGISPLQPKPGVNHVYDERLKQWGTSFKLISEN